MDNKYVTRKTLLQRALDPNDDGAWAEFVRYYKEFILMLLRKMNVSSTDSDDITQNILVRIWKKLEVYDAEQAKFRTWFSSLVRNEVYSYYAAQQRVQKKQDALENEMEAELQVDEEFDKMVEREWSIYVTNVAMRRIKKSFTGNAIQVFQLTLDGVDAKEIAERLDISINTVYALRNRVKQKLHEEIKALREELEL
ncbi:RNA polymerase sigma factor [Pontiella sulfatireligans]|uniref:RNA polymerase sigma factor SigS n=1 Tax=Pontiella sulfatireligans TaxID=2750658 RepID=A0A6C2ULM1_9BACT|nr:sigma-70 family RNA polymerase sigma factor [Pontiella sulfatireligans]VGO20803.1 hypothetical protein SCARR_02870 [Pontiella sulfatireligans]